MHNIDDKQINTYLHDSCIFIRYTAYKLYKPVSNSQKDPAVEEQICFLNVLNCADIMYKKEQQ